MDLTAIIERGIAFIGIEKGDDRRGPDAENLAVDDRLVTVEIHRDRLHTGKCTDMVEFTVDDVFVDELMAAS